MYCCLKPLVVFVACGLLASIAHPLDAEASDPIFSVTYDTPLTVSFQEVARSGDSKTIIVTIPVSVKFQGDAKSLSNANIEFESPDQTLRVVDFLPQTTTTTDIVGPIQIETTKEAGGTLKFQFGHDASVNATANGLVDAKVAATKKVDASGELRYATKLKYEQLPARELLLASGIRNRGHGVFFKLKPNSQHSIEGQHNFVCLFNVKPDWKCDYLVARCYEVGVGGWIVHENRKYIIGMHLKDDPEANATIKEALPSIAKYHLEVLPGLQELQSVRSSSFFPYFGLGTKAAEIQKRLSGPQAEYENSIAKLMKINSYTTTRGEQSGEPEPPMPPDSRP